MRGVRGTSRRKMKELLSLIIKSEQVSSSISDLGKV